MKFIYLTGTVELSGFESDETVIFTLFVILTVVHTSPKRQTVVVDTSVPILIFLDDLNRHNTSKGIFQII